MIASALDFENTIENAVASVLTAYGLDVLTTGQVYDYQKIRPRVMVRFTLGPGHLRWVSPATLAAIGMSGQRIENAWSSTLTTVLITAADAQGKIDQAALRGFVRLAYSNLAAQVNGTLLTLHKINLVKESGYSRAVDPQKNIEELQLTHDLEISLQESAWTQFTRITSSPSVPAIRITTDESIRITGP